MRLNKHEDAELLGNRRFGPRILSVFWVVAKWFLYCDLKTESSRMLYYRYLELYVYIITRLLEDGDC